MGIGIEMGIVSMGGDHDTVMNEILAGYRIGL